jgi:acetyl esterase/lipase
MANLPGPGLRGGPVGKGRPTSVALVLHGGQETSNVRTSSRQLSYVRMLDFYSSLRRRSAGCAIYLLRYRVRGWNADGRTADPVVDARWALDRIRMEHPGLPIALLGHSMGGRTAFAVADQPDVVGVCTLAPWLPDHEPVPPVRGALRLVIAHGTSDRMTSSPLSRQYAEMLRVAGHAVARFELAGARHALLGSHRLWRSFAVRTTLGLVGDGPLPWGVAAALDASSAAPPALDLDLRDFDTLP